MVMTYWVNYIIQRAIFSMITEMVFAKVIQNIYSTALKNFIFIFVKWCLLEPNVIERGLSRWSIGMFFTSPESNTIICRDIHKHESCLSATSLYRAAPPWMIRLLSLSDYLRTYNSQFLIDLILRRSEYWCTRWRIDHHIDHPNSWPIRVWPSSWQPVLC